MPNRLASENSPYLLQHKDNPVDWYPWGSEALDRARREDKPIFLSIGYAACHWCHVMEHESFEDPDTAEIMNDNFVNIKVDREERPDLDNIYMNAVVAMTGQGGWPMSVFLTPEGKPFYGGTYFPPVRRYNMPAFRDILMSIIRTWRDDREQIENVGTKMAQNLVAGQAALSPDSEVSTDALDQAAFRLAQAYDWRNGGWGKAPKFPQPMAIHFLLRRAARGDNLARQIATHALKAMAAGGMYDVVGGGFARYSVDDHWLVPHFEKMLYDNAQLALVYLYAYKLTGGETFRRVCEQTIDFVVREMTHTDGGFYSSLDADSEGEEGKYYVWTPDELAAALDDQDDIEFITRAYSITEGGNFEGKTVLQRAIEDEGLMEAYSLTRQEVWEQLDRNHLKLQAARATRVRPATDDKILVAWNALMLLAVSEAARYLKREDYQLVAMRNARFLLRALHPADRLLRSWREGSARHNAYLEDYAALCLALLALYQVDPNPEWYTAADRLANDIISHFKDPAGGFFDTRADHEALLVRPKDLQDNATPSGNSLAATALLQLATFSGDGNLRDLAETMLAAIVETASRYPTGFAQWLCAIDFALAPVKEVALLGNVEDGPMTSMLDIIHTTYRPDLVLAQSPYPPPEDAPPLLANRPLLDGQPTAYVCQQFICKQPVSQPHDLRDQLDERAHDASSSNETGQ